MDLTVCCCLWGDWPEKGLGVEYVHRLYRAVSRNITMPYKFVCFTDNPKGLNLPDVRELKAPSWKGCLPKLYVYSPEAQLTGRVLLFDLDNVITGSIDDMARYDGDLAVRAWFAGWDRGEVVADGDMIGFRAGGPAATKLWEKFIEDVPGAVARTGGRERFHIRATVVPDLWQKLLPGQIYSYKNHLRGGSLPYDCRVVSFHGDPRPHKLKISWLKEHWK